MSFITETCGKWILAGEHAVLRGCPALVFPANDFKMNFNFENAETPMQVRFEGPNGGDLQLVFWGLIEQGLSELGRSRAELTGYLKIQSAVPLGAGLGASAALCVGTVRLFEYLGWTAGKDLGELARFLEGIFHGESSGVDTAVAMTGRGLKFHRGQEPTFIEMGWQPKLYLSYSGERGATSDCVQKVESLRVSQPEFGAKIDNEMRLAVGMAEDALVEGPTGFAKLKESIALAGACFQQWGLTSGALDKHINELRSAGASAAKPTGSGGGGYVLSLWDTEPTRDLSRRLIPLFRS